MDFPDPAVGGWKIQFGDLNIDNIFKGFHEHPNKENGTTPRGPFETIWSGLESEEDSFVEFRFINDQICFGTCILTWLKMSVAAENKLFLSKKIGVPAVR